MGWCNYIVVDKLKLKFEISRNVLYDEYDDINERMNQLFAEYEFLHDVDVSYDSNLSDRAKNSIMNMGFKLYDVFVSCMSEYYFYDFMLMSWLKKHDFEFRVITEFDLDKDDEPAKDYKTIDRWGNKHE